MSGGSCATTRSISRPVNHGARATTLILRPGSRCGRPLCGAARQGHCAVRR
jgi:hypothetical protein